MKKIIVRNFCFPLKIFLRLTSTFMTARISKNFYLYFLSVIKMEEVMEKFIREHQPEIDNGAVFCPRPTRMRRCKVHYPTETCKYFIFEVDDDIFLHKNTEKNKNLIVTASGRRIDNNKIIRGDLIKRPMIYFFVDYENKKILPIEFVCHEIANFQGRFIVHPGSIDVYKVESIWKEN